MLQEWATLKDLKEKVFLSTGVLGHLQQLTFDAHGVHPILAVDSAPLSSVGLGHGAVIWLGNVFSASPLVSGAASSHQRAKSFCTLNQQDFPTLQDTLPAQFRSTQVDATSSPASAQLAPALWDWPPSAARLAATPHEPPVTMVPVASSGSAVAQSSAQSVDAGGSRYSPPVRIQRALRLAHLHDANRKWLEREAALLARAHNTQPGPVPLPMSPEDSTRALTMLRDTSQVRTSPVRSASPGRSRSPPSCPAHGSS